MSPLRVQILLFDQVEVLDFAGPYEVFTTASRMQARATPQAPSLFEVACVSRDGATVQARAGLRTLPNHSFATAGPCELLLVPGGVVDQVMACTATLDWVRCQARTAHITASVCTGAFVLAASGLLTEGDVITHWEDVDDLRARFANLTVRTDRRWIDRGAIVTSAGISAGIDMSLHLVARLGSDALAQRTARQMDYRWQRNDTG